LTILDQDETAPATIPVPKNGTRILEGAGSAFNFLGSATDNKGITRVEVSVNGGPVTSLPLTLSNGGRTASYTLPLTLAAGRNRIEVQSFDGRGNASPKTTTDLTFVVLRPLTVNFHASNPADSGTLSKPFPGTDPVLREVGKSYSVVATAKPGFIFDGWAGLGISGVAAEVPTLNFVFQEGQVITAKFIANPFLAVAGEYNGLVEASGPTIRSNETDGAIKVTVTPQGGFSGSLRIDGSTLPLSGVFDNSGVARFAPNRATSAGIKRAGKPDLVVALNLDITLPLSKKVTGTVSRLFRSNPVPVATSSLNADLKFFDGKTVPTSVPDVYLANKGLHTVVFAAQSTQPGLVAADYPQGDGIGQITVLKNGTVSLKGTLADGTPVTASAPVTESLVWPLFAPLYAVGRAAPGGSILGEVTFNSALPNSDLSGADIVWYRPYLSSVQYYPFGWPEGIEVDVLGAKYAVQPGVLTGLGGINTLVGNADLNFTDGLLAAPVSKFVNITAATNVATTLPGSDKSYSLKFTPANGEFSGILPHSDGTKPTYKGIVIQKGAQAGGYGYFLTTSPGPKLIDGTGQGGAATLSKKP